MFPHRIRYCRVASFNILLTTILWVETHERITGAEPEKSVPRDAAIEIEFFQETCFFNSFCT